ncbi:MAG: Ig-like domain-containing protein, partial [Novipirellula sp. JB048]
MEARYLLAIDLISVFPPPPGPALPGNDHSSSPAISASVRSGSFQGIISGTESADNRGEAPQLPLPLVEDQPPTVQILSPDDEQGIVAGTRVRVTVEANDDVAVRSVELQVDGQSVGLLRADPFVFEFAIPNFAGNHELEAFATDSAGQVRSHTIELTSFAAPIIDYGSLVVGAGAGNAPWVKGFGSAGETFQFLPYAASFTGGVRVASGDVNGDGIPDIISGAGAGGFAQVNVVDGWTGDRLHDFQAFDDNSGGGVEVASGDVSGDGVDDVIVAAGSGAVARVKVFDGISGAVLASFLPFSAQDQGGVRVAAGDLNGDGQAEIITAAGVGGGPRVRVFDGHTASQIPRDGSVPSDWILADFFAFDPSFSGSVFVAAADLNDDALEDIVVGADQDGSEGGGHVKAIDSAWLPGSGRGVIAPDAALLANFFAYEPGFHGGVRVAAGDVAADGINEIVVTPGAGAAAEVKVFDGISGAVLASFL